MDGSDNHLHPKWEATGTMSRDFCESRLDDHSHTRSDAKTTIHREMAVKVWIQRSLTSWMGCGIDDT